MVFLYNRAIKKFIYPDFIKAFSRPTRFLLDWLAMQITILFEKHLVEHVYTNILQNFMQPVSVPQLNPPWRLPQIWSVKPLPAEKGLNFPPLRCILHNLVHPSGNIE